MKNLSLFKLNMSLFAEFNLDKFIIFNRITEMLLKKQYPCFCIPIKNTKTWVLKEKTTPAYGGGRRCSISSIVLPG
jgi:hypothetical protein